MSEFAFPFDTHECASVGMTLRDYFAIRAAQAAMSNPTLDTDKIKKFGGSKLVAKIAYEFADAMIAVRENAPTAESIDIERHL